MLERKVEKPVNKKSHRARETGERQAEEGIPLVQRDPLAKVACWPGGASNASAHASTLTRATDGNLSRGGPSLLRLQRQYGNRYVQRVLAQAKSETEREAAWDVEQAIQRARGGGQALDSGTRAGMESSFGADFGGVRVHTDAEVDTLNRALNARALTTGQDIFFRRGSYNPGNSSGQQLLAHELTHVVQQNGDQVQRQLTVGQPGDRYEREADQVARALMRPERRVVQGQPDRGVMRGQVEDEKEEPVRARTAPTGLQRQTDEADREDFERDKQEIAVGVQAKMEGLGVLMRAKARRAAKGPLTDEHVQRALAWYARQGASYTAEVIRQIQEEIGAKPDGIIGQVTVQAIARWQGENGLVADGKAGSLTLKRMFGRDIRLGGTPKKAEVPHREEGGGLIEIIRSFLRSLGFSDEQGVEVLGGKEPTTAPTPVTEEAEAKPKRSKYRLIHGKNFASTLDGVSLKASLFDKMKRMAAYALENDLVTGNIVLSSGMRSPKKAHRWSTAYQIRQGNVPLSKLAALPDGKDMDGNIWYQPGWAMKEAKANARKVWSEALAAEGYPKGDKRREPNTFGGGVTRHATGKAIDATFLWNWSKGEGQKKAKEEKVSRLKTSVEKRWAKRPKKKAEVLAAIDKFIGRGSYSEAAYKTVEEFGLTRPVLHATGAPEDWHYEEG